jgi:hypothetical protein
LVEVLGGNQGPTKLNACLLDNFVFANGLRGNSRLKSLKLRLSSSVDACNRELLAIAGAVKERRGLVDLNLSWYGFNVNDETWGAICDSLKTHPTLEVLNLRPAGGMAPLAPAVLKSRIQAFLDMMKMNLLMQTIHLHERFSQHEIFRKSVIPYLDTNRFRPRVRAIQKTLPIVYRAKLLGQALLAARTDANRFWMILSGNAEVAFPSTTTPAANLPTPLTAAVAAASSNEDADDVAASVMSALTTNAAGSLSTATAAATTATSLVPNIATPSAGQKRKARP